MPMFIAALFRISRDGSNLNVKEMDKQAWYICTIKYYSFIKNNSIMSFQATRIDLEIVILSEVSQTERDKYHMISLIYGI